MAGTIVVGLDGSDTSTSALRWAARHGREHGAALHIVTAYRYPLAFAGYGADSETAAPHEHERAGQLQQQMLAAAGDELSGLEVTTEIRGGEGPGAALVAAAQQADLLVVGQHGLGGVSGFTIGSVSHYAVSHATCPVVVVPGER
jgi:nucleotide-binding universal stress UspA family protein